MMQQTPTQDEEEARSETNNDMKHWHRTQERRPSSTERTTRSTYWRGEKKDTSWAKTRRYEGSRRNEHWQRRDSKRRKKATWKPKGNKEERDLSREYPMTQKSKVRTNRRGKGTEERQRSESTDTKRNNKHRK